MPTSELIRLPMLIVLHVLHQNLDHAAQLRDRLPMLRKLGLREQIVNVHLVTQFAYGAIYLPGEFIIRAVA